MARVFLISCLLSLIAGTAGAVVSPPPRLAQRLGYGPSEKLLIIQADDIGIFQAFNEASKDLLVAGFVRSGTLIVPSFHGREALRVLPKNADLGVHLTLSAEWSSERWRPIAGAAAVPSLVDSEGALFENPFRTAVMAKDRDVFAEFEAQIQTALRWGMKPTHLDSHIGAVFYRPAWFRAYLDLARKYRLPPMIPRNSKEVRRYAEFLSPVVDRILPGMIEQVEREGHPVIDDLYILPQPAVDRGYASRKADYLRILNGLGPGVSQILLHPAYAQGDFLRKGLSARPGQMVRVHETRLMFDPEIREALRRNGIRLIGWREIQAVYQP